MFTLNYPKTIAEALDILINIMLYEEKEFLKLAEEEDLSLLRNTFWKRIRIDFGLYEENYELISNCKANNPEDASMIIVTALWKRLKRLE